jgi:nitrite reductase/ring-hydroxylating ferredoxin subunit
MPRYPLPATPDGWYRVADAAPLAVGDVRAIHYFGRDLALFRAEDGRARLFDAHCPHLGAHLGVGGRVFGDGIRCPFHGWCFDGDGRCIEVPRLEGRVPDARVRSYPVLERNGCVLAWFHACGEEPGWEVPEYREGGDAEWTPWTTTFYDVRTHVQDMGENILDLPHFSNVHDMDAPESRRFEARFEGPRMIVEQSLAVTEASSTGIEVLARTTNSGPGVSVTTVSFGDVETLTFITHTPVDENRVELRLAFCMRRMANAAAAAAIERSNREFVNRQFSQDIPIWENKIYREHPLLTAMDGPVPRYRRWYQQFYSAWEGEGTVARGRRAAGGG